MIEELYNSVKLKYNDYFQAKWKYKFYKILINFGYPILNRKFEKIGISDESSIIVSLTSFPERINTVWLTIVTLLSQTQKPKKVLLWLAKSQFEGVELPDNLKRLQSCGLEIKWCDDLKPHKKYYYTIQEYPDDCVVIADDDMFYPEDHLEILWNNYLKHPDCIIANKTTRIQYDAADNQYPSYDNWSNCIVENPSYLLVPIGCNGVLYPPHSLPEYTFDKNYVTEAVLYTDDLWLKLCAIGNNKKTFSCVENELVYFDCIKAGKVALWKTNIGMNRNEMVWKRLMDDFPQLNEFLYKEWKRESCQKLI